MHRYSTQFLNVTLKIKKSREAEADKQWTKFVRFLLSTSDDWMYPCIHQTKKKREYQKLRPLCVQNKQTCESKCNTGEMDVKTINFILEKRKTGVITFKT